MVWVEWACGIFSGYKFMDLSYYLYISKVIPNNKNAISACLKNAWGIEYGYHWEFFLMVSGSCISHIQCYCRYTCMLTSGSVICRWRTERYVLFKSVLSFTLHQQQTLVYYCLQSHRLIHKLYLNTFFMLPVQDLR